MNTLEKTSYQRGKVHIWRQQSHIWVWRLQGRENYQKHARKNRLKQQFVPKSISTLNRLVFWTHWDCFLFNAGCKINCPQEDNHLLATSLDLDPTLSATSMLALRLISARRPQLLPVSTEIGDRTQDKGYIDQTCQTWLGLNGTAPSAGNVRNRLLRWCGCEEDEEFKWNNNKGNI